MTGNTQRPDKTVLLPLDGSRESMAAVPVARCMAALSKATLHIVHVAEPRAPLNDLRTRLGLTAEDLAGVVLDSLPGPAGEAIVRLAHERGSELIVMTLHRGASARESGLGSVAEAVLAHSRSPLLLVPPAATPPAWALQEVLLPQDGTPASAAIIKPAVDLASRAGAKLLVLHVAVNHATPSSEAGAMSTPRYVDQPQHEWPAWAQEFIERVSALCDCRDLDMRFFMGHGEAGAEIARVARAQHADLIVLPWHGGQLSPRRAPILKSLFHDLPAPVLILRCGEAARALARE